MLTWLSSNAAALGIFGAIVAFAWSVFQFVAVRRKEQQIHEFEAFHRLIKELVSPDPDTRATWVDRQEQILYLVFARVAFLTVAAKIADVSEPLEETPHWDFVNAGVL
jgi:hypothetical protein